MAHHGGWIRPTTRQRIYLRDNWLCCWCGDPVTPETVSLDHLIDREDNAHHHLVTSCRTCNTHRGQAPVSAWLYRMRLNRTFRKNGGLSAALLRLDRRLLPLPPLKT